MNTREHEDVLTWFVDLDRWETLRTQRDSENGQETLDDNREAA